MARSRPPQFHQMEHCLLEPPAGHCLLELPAGLMAQLELKAGRWAGSLRPDSEA